MVRHIIFTAIKDLLNHHKQRLTVTAESEEAAAESAVKEARKQQLKKLKNNMKCNNLIGLVRRLPFIRPAAYGVLTLVASSTKEEVVRALHGAVKAGLSRRGMKFELKADELSFTLPLHLSDKKGATAYAFIRHGCLPEWHISPWMAAGAPANRAYPTPTTPSTSTSTTRPAAAGLAAATSTSSRSTATPRKPVAAGPAPTSATAPPQPTIAGRGLRLFSRAVSASPSPAPAAAPAASRATTAAATSATAPPAAPPPAAALPPPAAAAPTPLQQLGAAQARQLLIHAHLAAAARLDDRAVLTADPLDATALLTSAWIDQHLALVEQKEPARWLFEPAGLAQKAVSRAIYKDVTSALQRQLQAEQGAEQEPTEEAPVPSADAVRRAYLQQLADLALGAVPVAEKQAQVDAVQLARAHRRLAAQLGGQAACGSLPAGDGLWGSLEALADAEATLAALGSLGFVVGIPR